jgi:hypothetical protein
LLCLLHRLLDLLQRLRLLLLTTLLLALLLALLLRLLLLLLSLLLLPFLRRLLLLRAPTGLCLLLLRLPGVRLTPSLLLIGILRLLTLGRLLGYLFLRAGRRQLRAGLRRLLGLPGVLLVLRGAALRLLLVAGLLTARLLDGRHQVVELRDDPHATLLVTGLGKRPRAVDDLLDVFLPLCPKIGLRDLLFDLVQPLAALLGLLGHGWRREHQGKPCAPEPQGPQA